MNPSDLPRYIVLGDTILDREKIISVYMDKNRSGRVIVQLQGAEDHHFDGDDAVTLWRTLNPDAGWLTNE